MMRFIFYFQIIFFVSCKSCHKSLEKKDFKINSDSAKLIKIDKFLNFDLIYYNDSLVLKPDYSYDIFIDSVFMRTNNLYDKKIIIGPSNETLIYDSLFRYYWKDSIFYINNKQNNTLFLLSQGMLKISSGVKYVYYDNLNVVASSDYILIGPDFDEYYNIIRIDSIPIPIIGTRCKIEFISDSIRENYDKMIVSYMNKNNYERPKEIRFVADFIYRTNQLYTGESFVIKIKSFSW